MNEKEIEIVKAKRIKNNLNLVPSKIFLYGMGPILGLIGCMILMVSTLFFVIESILLFMVFMMGEILYKCYKKITLEKKKKEIKVKCVVR